MPPTRSHPLNRLLASLLLAGAATAQAGPSEAPAVIATDVAPAATAEPAPDTPDTPADAPSLSWSAFGTIGWARTDQPWAYQRDLQRSGSFRRDTVLGAQVDARISPEWSATLQGRLAPAVDRDNSWDLTASWAFVGWRPNNEWLVRAGKLRTPFFLRSEQLDVGRTYTEARLPAELYTLAPSSDFTGLHVSRNWELDAGELSLDAYRGDATLHKRNWFREAAGTQAAGAAYREVRTSAAGLVATLTSDTTRLRLGLHHTRTRRADGIGFAIRPVWMNLGNGLGLWTSDPSSPLTEKTDSIENYFGTLGAETRFGDGWHATGEIVRVVQKDFEMGTDAWGGYFGISREIGRWTPYASVSKLRSTATSRQWVATLDGTSMPSVVPGAAQMNAAMRVQADAIPAYDLTSVALGTALTLDTRQSLKFEWMRTRTRQSNLYDLPAGEPLVTPRRVDVYSVNYNFVF